MIDIAGFLFALYALYRALIGRPLKGKKRLWTSVAAITAEMIRANEITAPKVAANAITAKKLKPVR